MNGIIKTSFAALALTALAPATRHAAPKPAYTITDVGTLGAGISSVGGVNDSGQVLGTFVVSSGQTHSFISGPEGVGLTDLGAPTGGQSIASGINASGQVTGNDYTASGTGSYAFVSGPDGKGKTKLPSGNAPQAFALNDSGQVAGYTVTSYYNGSFTVEVNHAFLSTLSGKSLKFLGTLGGANSSSYGVNASGQVTGQADTKGGDTHAFLSAPDGGKLKDLGNLLGTGGTSYGYAVNESGQVTGSSGVSGGNFHAFLSGPNGGKLTALGLLPGTFNSSGVSVNAGGQVVGNAFYSRAGAYPFLYSGGKMVKLSDLIAPNSGYTLSYATGISDNGYIACEALNTATNQIRAVLLTPAK